MDETIRIGIRLARPADAGEIAHVFVDSWRDTYANILPETGLLKMSKAEQTMSWARTIKTSNLRNPVLVAADSKQNVYGFASAGPSRDRSLPYEGEVYTLYVAPDFQGMGIGRQLLLGLFSRLLRAGHNSAALWVLQNNPSRYFYERVGGTLSLRKSMTVGGQSVEAVAYGWLDLPTVLHQQARTVNRPGEEER